MPELPEVEVTRRGVAPHIEGRTIDALVVRNPSLRWPVPSHLADLLPGARVESVGRRGKFLLIGCVGPAARGTLIVHLGMTGTLRVHARGVLEPRPARHDHVDLVLGDTLLRYNDPRRFGAILWHDATDGPLDTNTHLIGLGVEPFGPAFDGERGAQLLHRKSRRRALAIKQFLLAGHAVVGVGNIYASETLFRAGIHPGLAAGRVSLARYVKLAEAIRVVLAEAVAKGGSTLRDFVGSDGRSGYFQIDYFVYDRAGAPCKVCATPIRAIRQGQRSSFYCPHCQRR